MRKAMAVLLAAIMCLCMWGCRNDAEYIRFHDETFKRADLSKETVEWLEWYNELTAEEQLSISYIPGEIHNKIYGEAREGMDEAAEAGS